jgi:hypothetical protein
MKRINVYLAVILFAFLHSGVNAADDTGFDYFKGKWDVLIKGTPQGDINLVIAFNKFEERVSGSIQDYEGNEVLEVTGTRVEKDWASVNFFAEGYDLTITLRKKDGDNVTGDMMQMFDVEGKRIIEEKEEEKEKEKEDERRRRRRG